MTQEKRFAVLIDADNISSKYIQYILDEVSNHGTITYKRIYGDWTREGTSSWKKVLLEHSILPVQQYSYTMGKNATDSAMIIDAMDILYSNKVEGFCIVSSDSDFTRLASRLRESGMQVIGMGEEKTPKAFCVACNVFKYIDILSEEECPEDVSKEMSKVTQGIIPEGTKGTAKVATVKSMTSMKVIKKAILQMISASGDDEKGVGMGEIGSRLVRRYPDFDVRNYGYSKLSKLLEGFNEIEIMKEGSKVRLKNTGLDIDDIENTVLKIIKDTPTKQLNMGALSQQLLEVDPKFNVRNYGYTKFSKLVEDFTSVIVTSKGRNRQIKTVILKR
ncbi:MAG: NYN domain-containing protein [Cellulosilyticaceae bacterium]